MDLFEKSPPGWSGTVKAMKKHKGEISNPWALSWWMKKKGAKAHYKPEPGDTSKSKKEPEKKSEYKDEDKKKKKKHKSFKEFVEHRDKLFSE